MSQIDRLRETVNDMWIFDKAMKMEEKMFKDLPWLEDLTIEQQDDLFQSIWEVMYQ